MGESRSGSRSASAAAASLASSHFIWNDSMTGNWMRMVRGGECYAVDLEN